MSAPTTSESTQDAARAHGSSLQRLVSCDRIGWDAIQHKDGWWVGTDKGVTCYEDHELARVALTIIWQREGGRQLNYRIKTFTGANVQNGEHTPKLSAVDALKRYEAKAANEPTLPTEGAMKKP